MLIFLLTETEFDDILQLLRDDSGDFMTTELIREQETLARKMEDQMEIQQLPRANLHFLYASFEKFFKGGLYG